MGLTTKRFFRHWSLRYLHDRLARAFYQHNFSDAPWLTRQANKVLSDWLKPEDSGIEWGAGHSTIWLSQRVKRLISIEHNKEWYEQIKQSLTNKGIENVELYFAPLAPYSQSPDNQEYLEIAERHSEQSMDFVFVDGRLRDHCTKIAMRLLKPGGLLIIDNAERYFPYASYTPEAIGVDGVPSTELWKDLNRCLRSWRCFWTTDGVADTAFFVRPSVTD